MSNPITLKIRTKKLGILTKDARLAAGKSMNDCAKVLGISSRQIGSFERGEKSPSLPELEALAFYLDVPISHFYKQGSLLSNREERVSTTNLTRLISLREKIVGARLKQARLDRDMNINDLAEVVGITRNRLKSYESGNASIPLPELEGMAAELDVPIEKFFDSEGVIGKWSAQKQSIQDFLDLPIELQNFVTKPINLPYLEIAQKLSGMSVDKLRALGEGLLDITL